MGGERCHCNTYSFYRTFDPGRSVLQLSGSAAKPFTPLFAKLSNLNSYSSST